MYNRDVYDFYFGEQNQKQKSESKKGIIGKYPQVLRISLQFPYYCMSDLEQFG